MHLNKYLTIFSPSEVEKNPTITTTTNDPNTVSQESIQESQKDIDIINNKNIRLFSWVNSQHKTLYLIMNMCQLVYEEYIIPAVVEEMLQQHYHLQLLLQYQQHQKKKNRKQQQLLQNQLKAAATATIIII